jgi:hypothetical protein
MFSQLVYVSLATKPFSQVDLTKLLVNARTRNTTVGVSGVLLHQAGSFLQVLEGEPDAVEAIYARVAKDPRHRSVLMLLRQSVVERNFNDWSMGFIDVAGKAKLLPGFRAGMTFSDLAGDPTTLMKMVSEYRAGRWHPNVT